MNIILTITPPATPRTLADVPAHTAVRIGKSIVWRDKCNNVISVREGEPPLLLVNAPSELEIDADAVLGPISAAVEQSARPIETGYEIAAEWKKKYDNATAEIERLKRVCHDQARELQDEIDSRPPSPPRWPTLAGKSAEEIQNEWHYLPGYKYGGLTPEQYRFAADFCEWRDEGKPDTSKMSFQPVESP